MGLLMAIAGLMTAVPLAGCSATAQEMTPTPKAGQDEVVRLIIRYETGAPATVGPGLPWGVQCLSRAYRDMVKTGRKLSGGMRVIRLVPPVTPTVARTIALQMEQCPYVDWVEPDDVVLTIP